MAEPLFCAEVSAERQRQLRDDYYAAYVRARRRVDWNDDGSTKYPEAHASGGSIGGYRAVIWMSYAFLGGNAEEVAHANRILDYNFNDHPCAFAPGAVIDVLTYYRDKLTPQMEARFVKILEHNVPDFITEDLKIHGYNDNHPYKAIHALILAGEILGDRRLVELGLFRLRQSHKALKRDGFPCEYNSPNYTPVSLAPLAGIATSAKNAEARDLAVALERFYWRDAALHFDSRAGVPTGPQSRAYRFDYSAMMGLMQGFIHYLFPEHFADDITHEYLELGGKSKFLAPVNPTPAEVSFHLMHLIWFARPDYHLTAPLIEAMFNKPVGARVRGFAEVGSHGTDWADPEARPDGAPRSRLTGARRTLIDTYYGENFSLGTAQGPWLDNKQGLGFYAVVAREPAVNGKSSPSGAAVYYPKMFRDDNFPFSSRANDTRTFFPDAGECRAIQHENTAVVFYTPRPDDARVRRMRTGIFRPLWYSQPRAIRLGADNLPTFNAVSQQLAPIAIDEVNSYVGIIPLPLSAGGPTDQSRRERLTLSTRGNHLSILITSHEYWNTTRLRYEDFFNTMAGFAFEIHPASAFKDFADFCRYLNEQVVIDDDNFGGMRTTTYRRPGLELSTAFCPYSSAYRYISVNDRALPEPVSLVEGMSDPGGLL